MEMSAHTDTHSLRMTVVVVVENTHTHTHKPSITMDTTIGVHIIHVCGVLRVLTAANTTQHNSSSKHAPRVSACQ